MNENNFKENLVSRDSFITLTGLMFGVLLSALDSTIVGTAMPKIIKDLNGLENYSLPVTAYMLCATVSIPIFGKLSDILGRKIIYLAGIALFVISSLLCGISSAFWQIVLFRGMQGIGSGILISNAFAIVGTIFPPNQRGKNISMVASMFGLSSIIGPLAGGLITDTLNWRWVFYINIPIGIASFILIFLGMKDYGGQRINSKIDVKGMIFFVMTLTPLLLILVTGGKTYPWISPEIIGMTLLSAVSFSILIIVGRRTKDPLIPFDFFKNRVFTLSLSGAFLSNIIFFGAIIFLPLYLQQVQKNNATLSGFSLTPMMIAFTVSSIISGQAVSGIGRCRNIYILEFAVALAGSFMLMFIGRIPGIYYIILTMIVLGTGLGINTPIFNIASQNEFPPQNYGTITANIQLFRNIGATVGSALFGNIMITNLTKGLSKIDWGIMPKSIIDRLSDPKVMMNQDALKAVRINIPEVYGKMLEGIFMRIQEIISSSITSVFIVCFFIALIALSISFFQKEVMLKNM